MSNVMLTYLVKTCLRYGTTRTL